MNDSDLATAADYADSLLVARRAKSVLVLLLIFVLLGQLSIFFLIKYDVLPLPGLTATTAPTTEPASRTTSDVMNYLCSGFLSLGLILNIVLSFILLLIVNIMVVGRLIGVSRVTSAYIWSIILLVFLFPWQAFLMNVGMTTEVAPWKLPGALYTWSEVTHPTHGAKFINEFTKFAVMKWVRFVAVPVVTLLILLAIQIKSNRGLRQALGEEMTPEPGPA